MLIKFELGELATFNVTPTPIEVLIFYQTHKNKQIKMWTN